MLRCQQCRDAVSARRDDEQPGAPSEALEAHLAACARCRRFAAGLDVLDALPVDDVTVPDRSAEILAAVRPRRSRRTPSAPPLVRGGLAVVGIIGVLTALADLSAGAEAHSLRDLGAFQIALAVGFLVAALRPATASGLLPTAAALALCLLAVVVVDALGGRVEPGGEVTHATELTGVVLVWLLARERPAQQPRRA